MHTHDLSVCVCERVRVCLWGEHVACAVSRSDQAPLGTSRRPSHALLSPGHASLSPAGHTSAAAAICLHEDS
ncbi:hypothetical protein AGOR_G00216970 [Albula goreensis]|uniref:Uncharacterized protein n=1 Tax=Albula goreensis TaxID=1534307 RepID=A0A8T3CQW1_9TELE|nr:hypothetical protein AGOR_G00216970 [Albula goreensis]